MSSPFKVCSSDRQKKLGVVASTLDELKFKGCQKLGLDINNCKVVLESDGTEIDDDEYLMHMKGEVLILLDQSDPRTPSTAETFSKCATSKIDVSSIPPQSVPTSVPVTPQSKPVKPPPSAKPTTAGSSTLRRQHSLANVYKLLRFADSECENNVSTITQSLLSSKTTDSEWVELWKCPEFVNLVEKCVKYPACVKHLQAFVSAHDNLKHLLPRLVLSSIEDIGNKEDVILPHRLTSLTDVKRVLGDIVNSCKIPDGFMTLLKTSCLENESLESELIMADALPFWSTENKTLARNWDLSTITYARDNIIAWQTMNKPKPASKPSNRAMKDAIGKPSLADQELMTKKTTGERSHSVDKSVMALVHPLEITESQNSSKQFVKPTRTKASEEGIPGAIEKYVSLNLLFRAQTDKVSQKSYYRITTVFPTPSIRFSHFGGYMDNILPYLLQRVKMRGCSILRPSRLEALVDHGETMQHVGTQSDPFANDARHHTKSISITSEKHRKIPFSRLDCLTCLLGSVHDVVASDLLMVMSQFSVAFPLVMRSLERDSLINMMSLLRGITIKWETRSGKIVEHSLFNNAFKLVAAVRLGTNPIGKSTILNQLFIEENMFSSVAEPGSRYGKPLSLNGSVEFVWLTQEICKDTFWKSIVSDFYSSENNEIQLLANLHGDANEQEDSLALLSQFAHSYVAFLMPDCTESAWKKFSSRVGGNKQIFVVHVDKFDNEARNGAAVDTRKLAVDETVRAVRDVIKCALNATGSSSPKRTDIAQQTPSNSRMSSVNSIVTNASQKLVDFVASLTCKRARDIMKLQTCNSADDQKRKLLEGNPSLQKLIDLFMAVLFLPNDEMQRAVFHLERELCRISNAESQKARSDLAKLKAELRRITARPDAFTSDQVKQTRQRVCQELKYVDSMSLGLEHFFREIGQFYEINMINSRNSETSRLPEQIATLFINGNPVEILDGDAGEIPIVWFTAICKSISQRFPKLRVYVVSVIGLQSSGKSTLLNTLFACRFAVSVGRCSRGLFMRLLFLDDELVKSHNYDAILLIDTEGLGSPERMGDIGADKNDRLLATFAMGISNLTIINVLGEYIKELTEILQIAIVTMTRLEKAGIAPDILMVQHLLTEKDAERTLQGEEQFCQAVRNAVDLAEKKDVQVGVRNSRCLAVLYERVQNGTLLTQFHPYKHGATANAPPSEAYHKDVVELYQKILDASKSSKTVIEFQKWHSLVASYWECVSQEDFTLHFKNVKEIYEFIDRGQRIAAVKQAIDSVFSFHAIALKDNEITSKLKSPENISFGSESIFQDIEVKLRNLPSPCCKCSECQKAIDLQRVLFEYVKDQPFETKTIETVHSYQERVYQSTVKKLTQVTNALIVQQGCCREFDSTITTCLQNVLSANPEGSFTDTTRKMIIDNILSQLEEIAKRKDTDISVVDKMAEEVQNEYPAYPDMVQFFRKPVVYEKIMSSEQTSAKNVLHRVINIFVDQEQVKSDRLYLKSSIETLVSNIIQQRKAECFEYGMVAELKQKVLIELEKFSSKSKLSSEEKKLMHVWAQQTLCSRMERIQAQWDKKNKPTSVLKDNEQRFRGIIETRLKHGFSCLAEGKIIGQCILKVVQHKALRAENTQRIRDVEGLVWTTNSEKVRLQYFSELATEVSANNKERALRHFRNPKQEIEAWFKKEIDKYRSPNYGSTFRKTFDRDYQSIVVEVKNAGSVPQIMMVVKNHIKFDQMAHYEPPFDFDGEPEYLKETIVRELEKEKKQFMNLDENLLSSPSTDQDMMSRLGCTHQCPWCGVLCWGQRGHEDNADETKKHHSSHQPSGLIRCGYRGSNDLVPSSCHTLDDERPVWFGEYHKLDEGILWKDAKEKHFSDWKFDKHYNSKFDELMRWFFQELHEDIAKSTEKRLPATPKNLEKHNCSGLILREILKRVEQEIN